MVAFGKGTWGIRGMVTLRVAHTPPVGVVWSLRGNSDISMGMGWVGLTPPTPTQKVIIVLATAPTVLQVVMSSSTSSPLYFLDNDQQPT